MIRTQTWKMSGHRERGEFIYTAHNFLKNNSISFPDVAVYGMGSVRCALRLQSKAFIKDKDLTPNPL